jgi:iron complex transport system ATP-binding protein
MSREGLEYRSATVGYRVPVVRDATLTVVPGEIVGLIGPNGAGKTTLLRAVTGTARLFDGEVLVAGRDVGAYTRRDLSRLVGVLPQTSPDTFGFTGRAYVEMGRHAHVPRFGAMSPADVAAVDRALELTDTSSLADEAVDTLSGGDLQRLTLAQTLAQEPSVLLLDEPTSHLDLNHRLQVLDVVRDLADGTGGRDPLAVLAVFHDLDMAARYSDRLAVVHAGGLRPADSPERVLTTETLEEVFGVRAVIGTDPVTGAVQVLPVVRAGEKVAARGVAVLVISGSGTGAAIMRRLAVAGFNVSAGALARGDTDERVATSLGAAFVPLAPYGEMDEAEEARVRSSVAKADVVVVAATPFGPANVGNLRAVASSSARVVLVGSIGPDDDFTRGEASALWDGLATRGSVVCREPKGISACVEEAMRS